MDCLIALIVYAIVLLIIVLVIEAVIGQFIPQYAQVAWLVRLLCGLLLIVFALSCLTEGGGGGLRLPHITR